MTLYEPRSKYFEDLWLPGGESGSPSRTVHLREPVRERDSRRLPQF